MGKYDPLAEFLQSQDSDYLQLTFGRIEGILGDRLPPSARKYTAWWANDVTHIHGRVWLAVGWKTESVSLSLEELSFRRMK